MIQYEMGVLVVFGYKLCIYRVISKVLLCHVSDY